VLLLAMRAPTQGMMGACCCAQVLLCHTGLLHGIRRALQLFLRQNIREKMRIRGGAFKDILVSFCCLPCSLAQQSTELEDLLKLEGKA